MHTMISLKLHQKITSVLLRRHYEACSQVGLLSTVNVSPESQNNEEELLNIFNSKGPPKYEKVINFEGPSRKESGNWLRGSGGKRSRSTHVNKQGRPLIDCLRSEYNHYKNQKYDRKDIPLASKGWNHYKSKTDQFTIKLYDDDVNNESLFYGELSSFSELPLDNIIVDALKSINVTRPTSIQEKSIPALLSGSNTMIAAETGCGKTLAYLLPVIQQTLKWKQMQLNRSSNAPLALIMCPSRELASQIGTVARTLSTQLPFSCNTLLGGQTKRIMMNPDFFDIDIQISTPGVMSKLCTIGLYDLQSVKHVVIDESDTMLDDSFNELLLRILRRMKVSYKSNPDHSEGCQLTLASATKPTSIYSVLEDFIEIDSLKTIISPKLHMVQPHVPQTFIRLGLTQKPTQLVQLVKKAVKSNEPVLIFSNQSKTCDWITLMLHENGVPIVNLNGDMPRVVRLGKFEQFKNGEFPVLSCTDIASRGLDTNHVKLVINYDFPRFMADYIHRCGRVGRYNSPEGCRIVNFITYPHEVELVNKIEMAVRTMESLPNVNANISRLIAHKKR